MEQYYSCGKYVPYLYCCLFVSYTYVLSFTFSHLLLVNFTYDVMSLFNKLASCFIITIDVLIMCIEPRLLQRMFTCCLLSSDLTLFVGTKWEEGRNVFSHDVLRGKVLLVTQAYLVRSN